MEAENTITDLRTVSFAVYLNSAQDSLVKKLADPAQEHSSVVPIRLGKVMPRDGEIGVFGTEKYFNTNMDGDHSSIGRTLKAVDDCPRKLGFKKDNNRVDGYCGGSKTRSGTPSISSKSSWGSQTVFLRSFQRNLSLGRQSHRVSDRRGFFAWFCCNKWCADRKSMYVSERGTGAVPLGSSERKLVASPSNSHPHSHPQTSLQSRDELGSSTFEISRTDSKRMEPFMFPVLNNNTPSKEANEPRKSLEVFGSNTARKRPDNTVEVNLERKLSMLTWDAIPKAKAQTLKSPGKMDDDMGSEASSELFEIVNISGSATVPPSTCCYEPSEVSIEWSVVTAGAADFSVLLEYDEKEVLATNSRPDLMRNSDRKGVE